MVVIETAPLAEFCALMPKLPPVMAELLASVKVMPAVPVNVRASPLVVVMPKPLTVLTIRGEEVRACVVSVPLLAAPEQV